MKQQLAKDQNSEESNSHSKALKICLSKNTLKWVSRREVCCKCISVVWVDSKNHQVNENHDFVKASFFF